MSKGKLLLADDSVTIQKVVNLTFADEGVEVVTAGNGDLAMDMIGSERPDVILADVNMPGLNGYEICERLRQSEETKDIPVLLLVGSFEPFDEAEAARVGASGFLTKPFQSIRHLITQVAELLESSRRVREENNRAAGPAAEEPWSLPQPEEPQTADIEDLYNQSFAETVEIPAEDFSGQEGEAESTDEEFADAGMDDAIIETTYIQTEAEQPPSSVSPFEERVSNEAEHEVADVDDGPQSFDRTQEMPDYDPSRIPGHTAEPVEEAARIVNRGLDTGSRKDEEAFSLGGDLLELPAGKTILQSMNAAPSLRSDIENASPAITELSPELIDRIVEKVIQKMAEIRRHD